MTPANFPEMFVSESGRLERNQPDSSGVLKDVAGGGAVDVPVATAHVRLRLDVPSRQSFRLEPAPWRR